MKIIIKLTLSFLTVALLILVVGYFSAHKSRKMLEKTIGENAVSFARETMNRIDRNIYNRIEEFQLYSNDLVLQEALIESNQEFDRLENVQRYIVGKDREWTAAGEKEVTPFMKELINCPLSYKFREELDEFYEGKYCYKVLGEIFITNRYGANVAQTEKTSDYFQADEEWWQIAKRDGVYVGDYNFDESAAIYSIDICIRITDKTENFLGVFKAVLNIEEVIRILESCRGYRVDEYEKYKTRDLNLFTKDGKVIYSTEEYIFNETIPDKLLSCFRSETSSVHSNYFIGEGNMPGEGKELFAHAHSKGYLDYKNMGWILVVEYETEEIFAPVYQLRNTLLYISFFGFILAIMLGVYISRMISNPIVKLKDAAQNIGKGELNTRVEIKSKDELGDLSNSFNKMAGGLKNTTTSIDVLNKEITERMQAERALEESERKLDSIIRKVPDIIYQIDTESRIIFISPAIKRYGYTQKELIGKSIFEIVHPEDREKAKFRINERRTGKRHTKMFELRLLTKDQAAVAFEIEAEAIKSATTFILEAEGIYDTDEPNEAGFQGTQGIARDITQRKQLENQLQQSQKMEAIGRLAGGIAHDFNNLLTAILGYADIIMMNPDLDDSIAEGIIEIKKAGDRAASLTYQLLAFSRKQILKPQVINANDMISDVRKMLIRIIGEDIQLITKLDPEAGDIKVDTAQIEQVIMNLAVNARDAMPEGGDLYIETQGFKPDRGFRQRHREVEPGNYVMLAVSDTGHGMDEETRRHIFDPFFTTKEVGKGTGLGLSMVYGIVKQSKGYIYVYSEPDRGATFKIYLPRIAGDDNRSEGVIEEIELKRGSETILIAEDEESVRKMVCKILENYGYTVVEAGNGIEALEIINRSDKLTVDLLLTDVIMPEMGGRELAARLTGRYQKLKVLYISGYTDNVIFQRSIIKEGASFLQKPFSPQVLLEKVQEVLKK